MVEDRITDPKRVAEFLSSELTGLKRGPLSRVGVVDADRDAEPSTDGTLAYRVALDGDPLGRVTLFESATVLRIPVDSGAVPADPRRADLTVGDRDGDVEVRIESVAAVKEAVDVVAALLDDARD